MIRKIEGQYFEMASGLLYGLVVDAELSEKLQKVMEKANAEITQLIKDNMEHVIETASSLAYPRGKQVTFRYKEKKPSIGLKSCLKLFNETSVMRSVDYLFETDMDWKDVDKIKAFAQRSIEDELDKLEGNE